LFAKYSSEKFPMAFIYQVLTFRKDANIYDDDISTKIPKIFPVNKSDLNFFSRQGNSYNYEIFLKSLKKINSQNKEIVIKKNKHACSLYSRQSVIGISNDLHV